MAKPILTLEGLSKFYTSAQNVVMGLNNVSLSFCRGEFVAITGESGSGKSTLAHVIGGILPYESGELYFNGRPTSHYDGRDWEHYRRDHISFISQNYGILLSATVLENVVSALRLSGMEKKDARREAGTILRKVELWELRNRRAAKLSSGQKQRLSIARALAKPAPILIADEPTGNLDPENSAKVIELLAEAAKDRLVLLITHDFQEAEGCATRRISLQDGRITMDAVLRPACEPEPSAAAAPGKKKQPLSLYVSRLQLAGRPVWGTLVLLFFALTAFSVFAFLGTFIVALDDANTRVYDDSAFPNGDPTRIVVQRADGEDMTQTDYDTLLGVKYVDSLEKSGYLTDINCYYLADEQYRVTYYLREVGNELPPVYEQAESVEFLDDSYFARTVPLLPEGGTFLTAGRLPENCNEVVLAGDESLIGSTIRVYLQDHKDWSLTYYLCLDVTVVGVTDCGSGIYFHDDVGRIFTHKMLTDAMFAPRDYLTGEECVFPAGYFYGDAQELIGQPVQFGGLTCEIAYFHSDPCPVIYTSYEKFSELVGGSLGDQVSLTISNYAYTDRVLKAVQDAGYVAVSPYRIGSTTQIDSLVAERIQTLVICAAVLLVVVFLQIIVLRALFGSELENYRLLANIGLTCRTAKRSILWQILLFTALGQAVGFAALWQCSRMGIERIVNILRYLPAELMAVLSAVHLAAALIAAFWLGRTVQKRVYPMFIHRDDLALDAEEAEV